MDQAVGKLLFYACAVIGILGFVSGLFLIMNGNAFGIIGIISGIVCYGIGYFGINNSRK